MQKDFERSYANKNFRIITSTYTYISRPIMTGIVAIHNDSYLHRFSLVHIV